MINIPAGTFKLAHQSLLKLKKYEGLLYNEEHEVSKINLITDTHKGTDGVTMVSPQVEMLSTRPVRLIGAHVGSVINLAT